MPLQKTMYFFGQLSANPFGGRDFFHARAAESIHGTKFSQQQVLAVLTHTGAIVQNAFADSFFHEQLMIGVGEAMRFVANALEQSQGAGIQWKLERQRAAWPINFLMFLRQADDGRTVQTDSLQFTDR